MIKFHNPREPHFVPHTSRANERKQRKTENISYFTILLYSILIQPIIEIECFAYTKLDVYDICTFQNEMRLHHPVGRAASLVLISINELADTSDLILEWLFCHS